VVLDAIVVGAGLSGLICARRLAEAGARIAVIEARDRVGGRLHGGRVGGALVDLGGQWMTAGQARLAALASELGVALVRHDRSGRALPPDDGGLVAAVAQWRAMRRIEHLIARLDRPGLAAELDRRSLADWLAREIRHPIARARIALHADLVFATDPTQLSLLYYLQTMRATSGFRPAGEAEHRFVGGAARLADRLAEALGDQVRLDAPVTAIDQAADAVVVTTGGARAHRHQARRVVLALPPWLVRDLAIELPPAARGDASAARCGHVVKCFAAYDRAYWRERGYSGESYYPRGAVRATVEIAGEAPLLLAFVVGSEAARWSSRDRDERREKVLAALAPLCPEPPIDYLEVDWRTDRWSAGCVLGLPPGVLAAGARWGEPFGRVHVAGTESASEWPGYMEGAVEAGERAAREVLAAL
jgi:monoamine oxidase